MAEYDGAGTLLRKFVYGPGIDEPICLIDAADANALYYYHFDGLGSVVALCDVNSALVERYAYDVFGRSTIRDAGGTVIAESAIGNPYLFTGRAWDSETALYYYRARYYDYYAGQAVITTAEWAYENPGNAAVVVVGAGVIVFDIVTVPSGEGALGVAMIKGATMP